MLNHRRAVIMLSPSLDSVCFTPLYHSSFLHYTVHGKYLPLFSCSPA